MAKVQLSQFSFNRGELDPALHGRSDWKYYFSGAEKLLNLLCLPQGGAVKRSGLRFIAEALSQEKPSFFIPFTFSVKQSYMLEMGNYQMRIIMDGGLVEYPEGHARAGQVVVVETPYSSDDLELLRYAQLADVMYLTLASHRPRTLKRYDHWDWRFDNMDLGKRIAPPNGLRLTLDGKNGAQYCVTALASQTEESMPSDAVTCTTATGVGIPVPDYGSLTIEQCYYLWTVQYGQVYPSQWNIWAMTSEQIAYTYLHPLLGFSKPSSEYTNGTQRYDTYGPDGVRYKMLAADTAAWFGLATAYTNAGYGGILATMRQNIQAYVTNYNNNATPTGHSTLAWNARAGAIGYKIFRAVKTESGVKFYYIGTSTTTSFDDNNLGYDSSRGLPAVTNPFNSPGDYPGVCTFFEQRMVFARTDNNPTTFWGSQTGDYDNFDTHTPMEDADSYKFTLSSGEMNEILWIVPVNEMLFGTSGSEWKAGGGSDAIGPKNVNARVQSWYGCAPMNPVVVGRTVVFLSRSRRGIRTFSYSLEANGYAGRDITTYAGHLFAGRTVVSMAYQQEQMGILWVVMSDGELLSCTFDPDEDVIAWSRHKTKGRVESCGAMKDIDGTDQAYFCIARDINGRTRRFIETIEDMITEKTDIADMFYVDSGLSYTGTPVNAVSGLNHLEGEEVVALADGNVINGLKVAGGRVEFPNGMRFSRIHIGLPYKTELQTLELEPPEGGTIQNRPRWVVTATVRFWRSRECDFAVTSEQKLQPVKFRTERFDQPIQPYTGVKKLGLFSTANADSARVYLSCVDPVPFGVLGIVAEASIGQAS